MPTIRNLCTRWNIVPELREKPPIILKLDFCFLVTAWHHHSGLSMKVRNNNKIIWPLLVVLFIIRWSYLFMSEKNAIKQISGLALRAGKSYAQNHLSHEYLSTSNLSFLLHILYFQSWPPYHYLSSLSNCISSEIIRYAASCCQIRLYIHTSLRVNCESDYSSKLLDITIALLNLLMLFYTFWCASCLDL